MDAELRYQVTKSIVEEKTLTIPKNIGIPGRDGRYYSFYGPLQSVLAVPLYVLSKPVTKIFNTKPDYAGEFMFCMLNTIFVSLICVIFFAFLIKMGYPYRVSLLSTLALGLATPIWFYAKYPYNGVQEAFFVLLSFYFVYKKRFVFSGIALGLAILTRAPVILSLPALLVFAFSSKNTYKSSLKGLFMGLLPFILIFFIHNWYIFGNIFETGRSFPFGGGERWLKSENPWRNFIPYGLYGLLLSPGKGIIFYAPVLILSFVGMFFIRERRMLFCIFLLSVAYILFYSATVEWDGSFASFGPRYILPALPFLMFGIASYLVRFKSCRFLFYVLFLVGILIQIGGISANPQRYAYSLALREEKGEEIDMVNSPGFSPVIGQFKQTVEVFRNLKRMDGFEFGRDKFTDYREALSRQATVNLPWFWWIYIQHFSPNRFFIPSLILFFLIMPALSFVKLLIYDRNYCISTPPVPA